MTATVTPEFKVGTIICVTSQCCIHWERQGQIVSIEDDDHPLKIWFGKECDHLGQNPAYRDEEYMTEPPPAERWRESKRVYEYQPDQVVVSEGGWLVKTLADRYWRKLFHTITELKEPFRLGGVCWINECYNPASQLIVINHWGNVFPAHGCLRCAQKYHLKALDDCPTLKLK